MSVQHEKKTSSIGIMELLKNTKFALLVGNFSHLMCEIHILAVVNIIQAAS